MPTFRANYLNVIIDLSDGLAASIALERLCVVYVHTLNFTPRNSSVLLIIRIIQSTILS